MSLYCSDRKIHFSHYTAPIGKCIFPLYCSNRKFHFPTLLLQSENALSTLLLQSENMMLWIPASIKSSYSVPSHSNWILMLSTLLRGLNHTLWHVEVSLLRWLIPDDIQLKSECIAWNNILHMSYALGNVAVVIVLQTIRSYRWGIPNIVMIFICMHN